MNNLEFGATLKIPGQESATAAEAKVKDLKAAIVELATGFEAGELDQKSFSVTLKALTADLRATEQSSRILATAQREQAATAAAASTQTGTSNLAHTSEMEAMAIQHETAMLEHEQRQLAETAAAKALAASSDLAHTSEMEAMAIAHETEMLRFEQQALANGAVQIGNYTVNTRQAAGAAGTLGTAMGTATHSTRNMGQAVFIASQGLEDMQYGFNGVINNIPYLVMSLGGPMGVAAAVSVVTVGAYQLYKHWDQVANIFEAKQPFPKAANDLAGLNEQLDKTKKELEELGKLSSVTVTQANRVEQLRQAEKDIEEQVKIRQEIEALGKSKSTQEEAVAKAFKEAINQSGGGDALASLKDLMGDRHHTRAKGFQTADEVVQAILKGDMDAYDLLVQSLGKGLGRESKIFQKLKDLRPDLSKLAPTVEEEMEKAEEAFWAEYNAAFKEATRKLTTEGMANEGAMMADLGKEARKGIEDGIGGRLKDILIRTRAAGSKGAKEVQYLTGAIADELSRMMPELAKFPGAVARVAAELARTLQLEVNKAIEELMRLEGLTKREALRRLDQQRAEKGQEKTEALATDAFKQAALTEARRNAQLNPGEAPATPKGIAERAQQMQDQLKELGVSPKQQVQIGKVLNDPQAQRLVPGAMEALQGRGFNEGQAMRALPEFFRTLRGGQAGIEHAADRLALAAERAERAAFQRAALQATAVPRQRARERPGGNLPNTVIDAGDPGRQRARDAERDRLIREQDARDAKRNEGGLRSVAPTEGPQANLAPIVAGTQQAMASTQAVQQANMAIVAALNLRVRTLESNARGMLTRAQESAPTASASGGNVA